MEISLKSMLLSLFIAFSIFDFSFLLKTSINSLLSFVSNSLFIITLTKSLILKSAYKL